MNFKPLSSLLRSLALAAQCTFGIIPVLLFVFWIERNCTLLQVPSAWGWPWVHFEEYPASLQSIWNLGLLAVFAGNAYLWSNISLRAKLLKVGLHPQLSGVAQWVASGGILIVVMGLWQNTGVLIWAAHLPTLLNQIASVILFVIGCGATISLLPRSISQNQLWTSLTVLYLSPSLAWSKFLAPLTPRSPTSKEWAAVGTAWFATCVLTPVLTLDRVLVATATLCGAWIISVVRHSKN